MSKYDYGDWDKSRPWTGGRDDNVHQLKLTATPAPFPDAALIPPRAWLYGTVLVRGFVSALIAPGGVGKTNLALAVALCLASGRSLLGDRVWRRVKVWYWGEDPLDELDRRIAALMIRFGLTKEDLDGWFFRDSSRAQRICMVHATDDGTEVAYPDRDAIVGEIKRLGIGAVIIDPFIKAHILNENSNYHMDCAAAAWTAVADETGTAVWVAHHTRKGAASDADAARGAKSLIDACRMTVVLSPMSKDEAKQFGLTEKLRRAYVRMDDVKVNLAPSADARWFQLESMRLGNSTNDYPGGDHVAVVMPWKPPSMFDDLPGDLCVEILDQIARGPAPGRLYAADRRGDGRGWVGYVVMQMTDRDEEQAAKLIRTWSNTKLLVREQFHDPDQRKDRTGVTVDLTKLAEMRQQFTGREPR